MSYSLDRVEQPGGSGGSDVDGSLLDIEFVPLGPQAIFQGRFDSQSDGVGEAVTLVPFYALLWMGTETGVFASAVPVAASESASTTARASARF